MRYSANLNIIIKAIEKASIHISRDFVELENLQSNPASCAKFASSCYNRIKQILVDDFTKFRPDFNITFSDGQKIINHENSEYSLLIHVIDGIENLLRASGDFTVSIALIHKNGAKNETISLAISKVIGGELFYSEKGFGAYLNNRRIRVSKRNKSSDFLVACDDINHLKNLEKVDSKELFKTEVSGDKIPETKIPETKMPRNLGCKTLDIAYFSCSRFDKLIHNKSDLYEPFLLLVRESGGRIIDDGHKIIVSNN
ncbi:MAG: hypothetical protein EBT63_03120 [Proteobacteria bacterium]|nr:hypothetical protein [Pseudomonadota bacterium]NCA28624.1 hypothetical protein [Pseudomonadota bacterium]